MQSRSGRHCSVRHTFLCLTLLSGISVPVSTSSRDISALNKFNERRKYHGPNRYGWNTQYCHRSFTSPLPPIDLWPTCLFPASWGEKIACTVSKKDRIACTLTKRKEMEALFQKRTELQRLFHKRQNCNHSFPKDRIACTSSKRTNLHVLFHWGQIGTLSFTEDRTACTLFQRTNLHALFHRGQTCVHSFTEDRLARNLSPRTELYALFFPRGDNCVHNSFTEDRIACTNLSQRTDFAYTIAEDRIARTALSQKNCMQNSAEMVELHPLSQREN